MDSVNNTPGRTGLGISLDDYIDLMEQNLAPEISDEITLADCKALSVISDRAHMSKNFQPSDDVEQRIVIEDGGKVHFRSFTYHNGPGHHGIGRVMETQIDVNTVKEICRMLDSWLFIRQSKAGKDNTWNTDGSQGKWVLRVVSRSGKEQIQTGELTGAFYAGIDVSQFVKERIPIDGLLLFDDFN